MPVAYVHLPPHVEERRVAFIDGFARLGFIVHQGQPPKPLPPGDAVVVWNQTGRSAQSMQMAQAGGGALLVAENGYYGADHNGLQPYALALDGHNGSGRWYAGGPERLERLNIPFQPFRVQEGDRVLIAAQRGIGSSVMRSPPNYAEHKALDLSRRGFTPIVREHPGRHEPTRTLAQDLEDVRCLVVWSSNCATKALIAGVPTYYDAPAIVSKGAARPFHPMLSQPFSQIARQGAFRRLAWAQWFLDEIASGEALKTLLEVHAGRLPACNLGLRP